MDEAFTENHLRLRMIIYFLHIQLPTSFRSSWLFKTLVLTMGYQVRLFLNLVQSDKHLQDSKNRQFLKMNAKSKYMCIRFRLFKFIIPLLGEIPLIHTVKPRSHFLLIFLTFCVFYLHSWNLL